MSETMTNTKWLQKRFDALCNECDARWVADQLLYGSVSGTKKYVDRGDITLKKAEDIAELCGLSIGEVFINPADQDCEWYFNARLEYFPKNLKDAVAEKRATNAQLAARSVRNICGVDIKQYNKYISGRMFPRLKTLQRIADTLGMEVSDLFLPPDGIGE